ncbi:UPF0126 domain-containing protein [Obelidium mucronatum]|nr:UPF0126 domain-containing protein [Obelidium mucronatum]
MSRLFRTTLLLRPARQLLTQPLTKPLTQRRISNTSNISKSSTTPHEGLPRWPGVATAAGLLRTLDWGGTWAFATSGALAAAAGGCDVFGAALVGTATAVGGGTLRDALVLGARPFWVAEPEYLLLSAAAAVAAFGACAWLDARHRENADKLLECADAVGLGAFSVIGAMNGVRAKDVLLNRPVRILHPYADTYAPIALTGASSYLALRAIAPQYQAFRIFSSIGLVVFLRQQAGTHGWRMPHWDLPGQSVVFSNSDPRLKQKSNATTTED